MMMDRNHNNDWLSKPSARSCHRPSTAADAAKSLLYLAVKNPGIFQVDAAVKNVPPNTRNRHLPILPPLSLGHDDMAIGEYLKEEEEPNIVQHVAPPSHNATFQWPSDVTFTIDEDNLSSYYDDDDDLSLSLCVGAENEEHNLVVNSIPYRDLSNIPFTDVAVIVNDPEKRDAFPVLLHGIVSNERYDDSIVWLRHGRAFAILDEGKFFNQVCQSYFCTNEYEVFMGWMEAYGFKQVMYDDGQSKAAIFFHERFLRYRQWVAFTMNPSDRSSDGMHQCPLSIEYSAVEVFQKLAQFPFLQDPMVPYSLMLTHPLLYQQRQQHLAHTYFPNPPTHYPCDYGRQQGSQNSCACQEGKSNGGGTSITLDESW